MFFFFNDTATTEIYTLSLHDALPISVPHAHCDRSTACRSPARPGRAGDRSEEHTSELQSRQYLVCRLLLEKKKDADHVRDKLITSTKQRFLEHMNDSFVLNIEITRLF